MICHINAVGKYQLLLKFKRMHAENTLNAFNVTLNFASDWDMLTCKIKIFCLMSNFKYNSRFNFPTLALLLMHGDYMTEIMMNLV